MYSLRNTLNLVLVTSVTSKSVLICNVYEESNEATQETYLQQSKTY
eukprot:SAG11_NODE_41446_length_194_cov_9.284211_1_plen_45_part_10